MSTNFVVSTTELSELQLDLGVVDYTSREYWNQLLAKEGLPQIGGFIFRPGRKLPPFKPRKPERSSKPMEPLAEEQLRRERLGESIGPVWGEARPFAARRVRLKSKGFKLSEKRTLLELGYERYIILDSERPAIVEGPDGAYLHQTDRRKHSCPDMDSDQDHPSTSASGFAAIPVPHAPYRSTGQEAFERRLSDHEAKLGLEQMRISSAGMQWAVYECAVKGRRPSEVIEGREDIDLETLKSYTYRLRTRLRGPNPVKQRIPREPIAFKVIIVDGKEITVSVYPPATRKGRFARKKR